MSFEFKRLGEVRSVKQYMFHSMTFSKYKCIYLYNYIIMTAIAAILKLICIAEDIS